MAVRSRRIIAPVLIPTTGLVVFTVPAARTLIVRQISIYNASSTVANRVRGHVNGTSGSSRWLRTTEIAVGDVLQLIGWWAFNPADTVHFSTELAFTASSGPYLCLFGSLLDGAPA